VSRNIKNWHNQTLHLAPKARAFFASAISEKNLAFAKSSLAFGDGELSRDVFDTMLFI